ncbi:MAG: ChbG/HpnK family deacetylase [Treponema sp.]|jgi:hypothetical protein|nr:ChbG/HpnK family deacetylase [Treponema sp.]
MKKIIVNADDFGISEGVNKAVATGYSGGIINSTSIMINLPDAASAVELIKDLKDLNVGLHVNLTNGNAVSPSGIIPLLADSQGRLKNGFVKLCLLSLLHPIQFRKQAEKEIEAQIKKAVASGIKLTHIDSHRHIHIIPSLFKIVNSLANKHNISCIRSVNENIFYSASCGDFSFIFDGGLIKYFLLRFFTILNCQHSDTYFYSILYTGKLFGIRVQNIKIPPKYARIELCLHPNIGGIDIDVIDKNVLSLYRIKEMETIMDKTVLEKMFKK